MGLGLTRKKYKKRLENHPKIVLTILVSTDILGVVYHVYFVCTYTLLKVVTHYHVSGLSISG